MSPIVVAQHTPGPWRWRDDQRKEWDGLRPLGELPSLGSLSAPDGTPILLGAWCNDGTADVGVNNEADARLIAAAPDLLAAAKYALGVAEAWMQDQFGGTSLLDGALAVLQPVRAAIAKAEGLR